MKYFNHFRNAIPEMLLFGILFAVIGYAVPRTYYQFFDKTEYYKIKSPIEVEQKAYQPCQNVKVYLVRNSLIDSQGTSIINLSLLKENSRERVSQQVKEVSMTKGEGIIITSWQLPCNIEPGQYFFEGSVKYKVRDFEKYTPFNTVNFEVVASGSADLI